MNKYKDLKRGELREIRTLVTNVCANYCKCYKVCLPLDTECYMLLKRQLDGKLCRYFKEAVLPLNPVLEATLLMNTVEKRDCCICGSKFVPTGRQKYCSEKCEQQGNKIKSRERMQKMREKAG